MATSQNVANIDSSKEKNTKEENAKQDSIAISTPASLWLFQPWLESAESAVKLQQIWLETVSDILEHETEFLTTLMASSSKLARCAWSPEIIRNPSSIASCYHGVVNDMAEAHLKRISRVSEISDDLREQLWNEM